MRFLLILVCCFLFVNGYSQYYFNDIISTQLSNDQYKLLRTHKIKKIKAVSYEADNSLTEGFFIEEEISIDGKRITLNALTAGDRVSVTDRTYESGKLKRTQAKGSAVETKTEYTYNEKGQVQKIQFTTLDTATAVKMVSTEDHEWVYNEAGQPVSMLKIKNKADTTVIELIKDEQGLIAEERWKKKNRKLETYYYYYDAKNRLTDIVRYNARLKKLLPDYLYEYDDKGRVNQMTQVSVNSSSYIAWLYTYTEKGLKQTETGYDREKRLVGRIEYGYELY
jgi:hypothetical protein